MSLLRFYMRALRGTPCPVCGKPDWCMISYEGGADPCYAICKRIESGTLWGEAGWLHKLRDSLVRGSRPRKREFVRSITAPSLDFGQMATNLEARVEPDRLHQLARELGFPAKSLCRLRIGFAVGDEVKGLGLRWAQHVWTIPMTDPWGRDVGLRVRMSNGRKLSVKGSRQGLFIPTDLGTCMKQLFVAEGETDTAALLALGLDAVGRPGATSASTMVARFVRQARPAEVVVVSDADDIGQRGASDLAAMLRVVCRSVRVVMPPEGFKDARQWIVNGASASEVRSAASVVSAPSVRSSRAGGRS